MIKENYRGFRVVKKAVKKDGTEIRLGNDAEGVVVHKPGSGVLRFVGNEILFERCDVFTSISYLRPSALIEHLIARDIKVKNFEKAVSELIG